MHLDTLINWLRLNNCLQWNTLKITRCKHIIVDFDYLLITCHRLNRNFCETSHHVTEREKLSEDLWWMKHVLIEKEYHSKEVDRKGMMEAIRWIRNYRWTKNCGHYLKTLPSFYNILLYFFYLFAYHTRSVRIWLTRSYDIVLLTNENSSGHENWFWKKISISVFNAQYELNVLQYTYCLTTIENNLCRVKRDAKQCL